MHLNGTRTRFNLVPSPNRWKRLHGWQYDQPGDQNDLNRAFAPRSTADGGSVPRKPLNPIFTSDDRFGHAIRNAGRLFVTERTKRNSRQSLIKPRLDV